MKRFVIYPDYMLENMIQVLCRKEPGYLHSILWIVFAIICALGCFVCFGKVDDVVKADGIVRPEMNVSSINSITSGEIESLFYKPGDFVHAGDRLLLLKGDGLAAQKKSVALQLNETCGSLLGLSVLSEGFLKNADFVQVENATIRARYAAFSADRKVLAAKIERTENLLKEELALPECFTTESEIENKRYEHSLAVMEYERFCADFYSSVKQEMDALRLEKEDLQRQMTQVNEAMENLLLVSPVDGFVQEKSSLNVGDYIFADQQVLNIVPVSENNSRIELRVPAESMGKLKVGQRVKIRFPAFPYSEFKGVEGNLNVIQPDSEISESGNLFFIVYASVDSLELKDKNGISYYAKPGFAVNARIVLENQSLLYFLLKKMDFVV